MGGGVIKIPPDTIDLNDGKLDMLMINLPKTLPRLMEVVGKLQKSVFDDPDIFFLSSERFEIETGTPVEWTLDGEDAGFHKNVVIEAKKSAIKLVRKEPVEIEETV